MTDFIIDIIVEKYIPSAKNIAAAVSFGSFLKNVAIYKILSHNLDVFTQHLCDKGILLKQLL